MQPTRRPAFAAFIAFLSLGALAGCQARVAVSDAQEAISGGNGGGWFGSGIVAELFTSPADGSELIHDLHPDSSTDYQLTRVDHECKVWPQERLQAVKAKLPEGFLVGFTGELESAQLQAMAGLPDLYIDYLVGVFRSHRFTITAVNPGFQGGVTARLSDRPVSIKVMPTARIIWLTMQHEIGHALEMRFSQVIGPAKGGNFDAELRATANSNEANPNLNAYPKTYLPGRRETYYAEYWGEAFNSFYCSEATNSMLQQQFPDTYALLRKYAEPPLWESNAGPQLGPGPQPNPNPGPNPNGNPTPIPRPSVTPAPIPTPQATPTLEPTPAVEGPVPDPDKKAWEMIPVGLFRYSR